VIEASSSRNVLPVVGKEGVEAVGALEFTMLVELGSHKFTTSSRLEPSKIYREKGWEQSRGQLPSDLGD
jgi:hypothetical protein